MARDKIKIFIVNAGGTIGMAGKPLRPAKNAEELIRGVVVPKNVELTLYDFEAQTDSSNLTYADRIKMAEVINGAYQDHDAFIILQGTDTLPETTSALSMILRESLQKPVFVVGSQLAKNEPGTEAYMQLANTMRAAVCFSENVVVGVYNVCIGDIWDGSRLLKRKDSDYLAFYTPGRYPVAHAWASVVLEEGYRKKNEKFEVEGLTMNTEYAQNVITMNVSADTPPQIAMDMLASDYLDGMIFGCKGTGNIPDRKWKDDRDGLSWIKVIEAATATSVYVGVLSPFEDGHVILDRYEPGKEAKDAGAISLESLTPPMADFKFRQAIAMYPGEPKKIQEFISTNIIGELL